MDVSVCTRDGAKLVDVPSHRIDPTASIAPDSLDISIDSGSYSHDSDVTRAARPARLHRSATGESSRPGGSGARGSAAAAQLSPDPPPASERGGAGAAGKKRARTRTPRQSSRPEERLGQTLGSYRLQEIIGRGGMGCVYRAEHVKLGREVALKLLRSDYAERRDSVARFFQEARAVNRIRHRNIVDITDFVELDDGTTFIIMELLGGTSLSKLMRTPGALDTPRILAILLQICDGLAAAHAVGIIHRDMKPDNVFVSPTGDGADLVKLLDFGVAKLLSQEGDDVGLQTVAGSVIGTPAFMSPEQAGGMPVDARSDLYCVGAIMYELFCGRPPFRGKSFGEFVRKHLNERPVPPRQTEKGAGTDERIEAVIMRCLEKRPDDRYQSANDLRSDLLDLLGVIETQTGRGLTEEPGSGDFGVLYEAVSGITGGAASGSGPFRANATPAPPAGGSGAYPQPGEVPAHTPAPSHTSGLAQTGPGMAESRPGEAIAHPAPGLDTAMAAGDLPRDPTQVRGPRRVLLVIGGAALLGGIAGLGIFFAARGGHAQPSPTVHASSAAATHPAPQSGPVVTPLRPAPATTPVSVHITSKPKNAAVFAFGSKPDQPPWGHTPCSFSIDPNDGPPQRRYIVRKPGYRDHVITIDLSAGKPSQSFHVSLQPSEEPATGSGAATMDAGAAAGAPSAPHAPATPTSAAAAAGQSHAAPAPASTHPAGHGGRAHRRRRRHGSRHGISHRRSGGSHRRSGSSHRHKAKKKHDISPADTMNPFGS